MAKNPITGLEEDQLKLKSEVKPLEVNVGSEIKPTTTPTPTPATTPKFTQEQEQGFDVLRKQYETQGYTPMQAAELAGTTYVKPEQATKPTQEVKPEEPKQIDTTSLSPEEQSYYSAQKTRIDAIAAQKGMSSALKEMKDQISLEKEKKFAKDVEEAMQAAKDDAARQAEITRINNERSIKDAEDKLGKQIENSLRFKGASGFPQTQSALKAQKDSIDRTRQVIGEMETIAELQKAGAGARLAQRMNELQDQLDLNVSKAVQETMTNLQTLISAGELDSVEAIIKAKTDLMEGLNNKYNDFLNNTYEASKIMLDQAENNLKAYRESTKYNDDFTKQIGDGFMYNNLGQRMVDASGNPLKSTSVSGKPLSTTPITLNDGTLAMIFQNEDGTLRTEKLEGTKPMQATPQAVAKYADLVSRGAMSVDDLRQLGFSRADINAIVSLVTPETTTKLKSVVLKDSQGNEVPASFDEQTGEYTVNGQTLTSQQLQSIGATPTTGGIDLRSIANKYPNEASLKNNNPAGITFNNTFAQTLTNAGIQFSKGTDRPKSEGGAYFSFPNIQEGFKAYNLLWNSPRYANLTVGKALQRWGTGSLPGVDTGKKVSDLTQTEKEQLQIAQLKKESPGMYKELVASGFIGAGGIELPETTTTSQRPISEDIDLRVGRIATSIYGKTASDKESKRVENIIKNNPNASDNDIMDAVLGFSIKPEYKQVSDKIHDIVLQNTNIDPKSVLPAVGRLINEGKIPEAVRSLENSVLASVNKDNLGNDKIREDKVKTSVQLAKSLDELIRKGESVVGPLDGTIQEWLGKFKSTEAQTIQRKIREITAKMRNELSGTAVTSTEALFLAPIIPELSDTRENALDKVKGLRTNPLTEYNNLRSLGGLPPLNETSLGDVAQRAKVYQNQKVEAPKDMQDRLKKSIEKGANSATIKQDLEAKGYDSSFLGSTGRWTPTTTTKGRWNPTK